jgi:hypothetical protein
MRPHVHPTQGKSCDKIVVFYAIGMVMNAIATELNEAQQAWLNQIRGWEKDIDALAAENSGLLSKARDTSSEARLNHFGNRFIIELGQLDAMKHNISWAGWLPSSFSANWTTTPSNWTRCAMISTRLRIR